MILQSWKIPLLSRRFRHQSTPLRQFPDSHTLPWFSSCTSPPASEPSTNLTSPPFTIVHFSPSSLSFPPGSASHTANDRAMAQDITPSSGSIHSRASLFQQSSSHVTPPFTIVHSPPSSAPPAVLSSASLMAPHNAMLELSLHLASVASASSLIPIPAAVPPSLNIFHSAYSSLFSPSSNQQLGPFLTLLVSFVSLTPDNQGVAIQALQLLRWTSSSSSPSSSSFS